LQEEKFIGAAPWGAAVSYLYQSPRLGAGDPFALAWVAVRQSLLFLVGVS